MVEGDGNVKCCSWFFRCCACAGMCATIGTLIIIALFCVDTRLEMHPQMVLNGEAPMNATIEEVRRR